MDGSPSSSRNLQLRNKKNFSSRGTIPPSYQEANACAKSLFLFGTVHLHVDWTLHLEGGYIWESQAIILTASIYAYLCYMRFNLEQAREVAGSPLSFCSCVSRGCALYQSRSQLFLLDILNIWAVNKSCI